MREGKMPKNFIDVKIKGTNKVERKLKRLERKVKKVAKPTKRPLSQLLNDKFMRKYTSYSSFSDFVLGSGLITNANEITEDLLSSKEFNDYVNDKTRFSSWNEMLQAASTEDLKNRIKF